MPPPPPGDDAVQEDTAEYGTRDDADAKGVQRVVDELLEKVQQYAMHTKGDLECMCFVFQVLRHKRLLGKLSRYSSVPMSLNGALTCVL